jgi:hypothetical protein
MTPGAGGLMAHLLGGWPVAFIAFGTTLFTTLTISTSRHSQVISICNHTHTPLAPWYVLNT